MSSDISSTGTNAEPTTTRTTWIPGSMEPASRTYLPPQINQMRFQMPTIETRANLKQNAKGEWQKDSTVTLTTTGWTVEEQVAQMQLIMQKLDDMLETEIARRYARNQCPDETIENEEPF